MDNMRNGMGMNMGGNAGTAGARPNMTKPNNGMNQQAGQQNMSQQISDNEKFLRETLIGTSSNVKIVGRADYPKYGLTVNIVEYQGLQGCTNIYSAQSLWFMNQANIRCRQIGMFIDRNAARIENGAMSYFRGPLEMTTGIKGVGGLVKQAFTSKLTNEKMVMPEYKGSGILVLEPSFKHFLILELQENEQLICDKGMFFASSASVNIEPVFAGSVSGTLLGGEGVFQQLLTGPGVVILESPVPMTEINKIKLNNDILRVDGNFALLRKGNISMSVETVSASMVGSAASGEGLVNVYRGTGEVWLAPTIKVYDALRLAASRGGNVAAVDFNTSTGHAK